MPRRPVLRARLVIVAVAVALGLGGPAAALALDPVRVNGAIVADDVDAVREAVQTNGGRADLSVPAPGYPRGAPLIVLAARAASLKVLRFLIDARADLDARTATYETALMLACYWKDDLQDEHGRLTRSTRKHDAAARMLLEAGASTENHPGAYTPLAYAAYEGREGLVKLLLERGARVDADALNGTTVVNTPLMMAAIAGRLDAALLLLRAGADPRIRKAHDGQSALELAQKYNQKQLLEPLRCAAALAPGESFAAKCDP